MQRAWFDTEWRRNAREKETTIKHDKSLLLILISPREWVTIEKSRKTYIFADLLWYIQLGWTECISLEIHHYQFAQFKCRRLKKISLTANEGIMNEISFWKWRQSRIPFKTVFSHSLTHTHRQTLRLCHSKYDLIRMRWKCLGEKFIAKRPMKRF